MEAEVTRKRVVDQVFGFNKAPMHEVLTADFNELRVEIDALVERMRAVAKTPPKTDEELAALGKVILDARALWGRADGQREAEKRPILDAGRELDAYFKDMLAGLLKGRDFLQGQADSYTRAKAAEERARKQREAEELARKAEAERDKAAAAKTSAGAANAEARAETLEARADQAAAVAASSEADLVRSRVGGVTSSAKGTWGATILDYQAAIAPLGALGNFLKRDAVEAALNSLAKVQKEGAAWPGPAWRGGGRRGLARNMAGPGAAWRGMAGRLLPAGRQGNLPALTARRSTGRLAARATTLH